MLQEITTSLPDGLQLLNTMCEASQRLSQRAPPELKVKVDAEVTELKEDWDKLNKTINSHGSALEMRLTRWNQFEDIYQDMLRWLAQVENQVKVGPAPKVELVEKKAQLEKYKVLEQLMILCSLPGEDGHVPYNCMYFLVNPEVWYLHN